MVSHRCKIVVKEILRKSGLHSILIDLGEIEIIEELSAQQKEDLKIRLSASGLELMDNKKAILAEKIVNVIIDMIHHSEEVPRVNYSDYLSEKLNYDYTYLSNIFSEVKGMSIQQFIIKNKIERAKELLFYKELNLTEISHIMNYSSVAYLSNQFKKITGYSPSTYKKQKELQRIPIEEIGLTFNSARKHG